VAAPPKASAANVAAGPSKAARKNAQRARRRAELQAGRAALDACKATMPHPTSDEGSVTDETVTSTSSLGSSASTETGAPGIAVEAVADVTMAAGAGVFAFLDYDALIILVERLTSQQDVRALACTCRFLHAACEDGMLWRVLFHKHYPASQISAASLSDWKFAYMLELSNNADRLACFHTKAELGARDQRRDRLEIFGIPLTFTVNPRTHEVDHIYSSLDTISYSAFADDKVRRSVWGEPFTHFLPLYLSAEHFSAAQHSLRRTIIDICAGSPSWKHARGSFLPEMALDVLPKLLCTLTVLLVDKGISASDVFIDGFVQIYRLLLAVAHQYPRLRSCVSQRVRKFILHERARTKEAEPTLGVLIPLLGIADGLKWCDLAWPLLGETMDRGVLWACRDHPELANPKTCSQSDLLDYSWSGRRVANRLLMFSVGFLSRLSKVGATQLDDYRGQPTPWLRASMRQHISRTLAADSWPAFFNAINVPLPSKAYVTDWVTRSVHNSLRKKYHKEGMDFSRVQRSGVSAILRKGESVSASPTMKAIRVEQLWRYQTHNTIFLDASALAYDARGEVLGHVDYASTRSVTGLVASGEGYGTYREGRGRVAMRHSGDVIDHERKEGKHTIDIDLRALSDRVLSIVLVFSAFTTTLNEIVRPEIRCFDPDDKSSEPLARYELEGRPTGDHTSVVMARIWRPAVGKSWKVTAIGELGLGRASNYQPIYEKIRDLRVLED
jgi:stress response protein SCP2